MIIKDKIFQALTEKQRQTPKQLSVSLEIDQRMVTECVNEMLETGVLTKTVVGNKRTFFTTEYVLANNIPIVEDYAYKVKKPKGERPTPTLDGIMLFNRLLFNKGLAAL